MLSTALPALLRATSRCSYALTLLLWMPMARALVRPFAHHAGPMCCPEGSVLVEVGSAAATAAVAAPWRGVSFFATCPATSSFVRMCRSATLVYAHPPRPRRSRL